MSEHKSPKDRLLDLLVYGPAGLALTAAEEFPKLVEKGRHRVEGQVHTARLVGQFAVQMGRQQVEQTVGGMFRHEPASPPRPAPAGRVEEESVEPPTAGIAPESPLATPAPGATTALSSNGTMRSDALGIPGYDSLSASQVVQRLGGLTPAELDAVRAHELAHRHRRTILNRVDQLLSGADAEHP